MKWRLIQPTTRQWPAKITSNFLLQGLNFETPISDSKRDIKYRLLTSEHPKILQNYMDCETGENKTMHSKCIQKHGLITQYFLKHKWLGQQLLEAENTPVRTTWNPCPKRHLVLHLKPYWAQCAPQLLCLSQNLQKEIAGVQGDHFCTPNTAWEDYITKTKGSRTKNCTLFNSASEPEIWINEQFLYPLRN